MNFPLYVKGVGGDKDIQTREDRKTRDLDTRLECAHADTLTIVTDSHIIRPAPTNYTTLIPRRIIIHQVCGRSTTVSSVNSPAVPTLSLHSAYHLLDATSSSPFALHLQALI